MGFLNPFHGLIETTKYPNARAYRTSFWQKTKDTFGVFSGSTLGYRPNPKHFGLLDYFTLGIHYYIQKKLYESLNNASNLGLIICMSILHALWCLPRILFGYAMTFLSMPGILFATMLTFSGSRMKEELLETAIHPAGVDLYLCSKLPSNMELYNTGDLFYVPNKETTVLYCLDENQNLKPLELQEDLKQIKHVSSALETIGEKPLAIKITYLELKKYIQETALVNRKLHAMISCLNVLDSNNPAEVDITDGLIHIKLKNNRKIGADPEFYLNPNQETHLRFFKTLCQLNIGNVEYISENNPSINATFTTSVAGSQ